MSASMKFLVTYFPTQSAMSAQRQQATMPELANRMRKQCAPTKAQLPWLKLASFGNNRTDKQCLRHNANIEWISGIEADYDAEKISFYDAVDILEQAFITGIIYTSASHTETGPRWRVLCPLSEPRDHDQRSMFLGRLNGVFGGVFSSESWTLSQAYYFGSVGAAPSHRVAEVYGHCIDQLDELDDGAIGKGGIGKTRATGSQIPGDIGAEVGPDAIADAELIRRIITGEVLHPALCAMAMRYVARGMRPDAVAETLRGFMLVTPEAGRDERWHHRVGEIPDMVKSAMVKFDENKRNAWKNIARITHRMIQLRHSSQAVAETVTEAAMRWQLPVDASVSLAERICAQYARSNESASSPIREKSYA